MFVHQCIFTGLGSRGCFWAGRLARYPRAKVAAYVEPDAAIRQQAIAELNLDAATIHPSLDDAIAAVEADFVFDVTPPAVHHVIAKRAFDAGLHVIGEKPLSDDLAIAAELVAAGEAVGRRHMVTQNYRFSWIARRTRQLLESGIIGSPAQLDIGFYMNWADSPGTHYVTEPFMFIKDMMVHHFDMMRYVLGKEPLAVQAVTWNQPWGWHAGDAAHAIVFEYAEGMHATHVSVGCTLGRRTTYNGNWRLDGPLGTLSWEHDELWHTHLHRAEMPVRRQIICDRPWPDMDLILNEFLDAVEQDREPECSARDNIASMKIVFAVIRSAEEKRRVSMDEFA